MADHVLTGMLPEDTSHGREYQAALCCDGIDCRGYPSFPSCRREGNKKEQPFDTVKGIFTEGEPAYENAGFAEKTHVQICVRNQDCIKGVFRVPDSQLQP